MRVEQQNINIVDALQQSVGPKELESSVLFQNQIEAKRSEKEITKSVNLKDVTYMKPGMEETETMAEKMEESSSMDAAQRKDQMAVLAGTTSPEDYKKMQEDGFSLNDTTTNTIITETDKIKAQLAKAGVDISYFGDDLSMEQLAEMTGSVEAAAQLAKAFKEADLPFTEENIKGAAEALHLAGQLKTPTDGALKYMLNNALSPTIENLYKAEFSGSGNYQPQITEGIDLSAFHGQIEALIEQSGFSVNEQTKADCQWMIQNNVPLTIPNFKYMQELKNSVIPPDTEQFMENIAQTVAEGKSAKEAPVLPGYNMAAMAQHVLDVTASATEEDLVYIIDHEMDLTVRNLEYAIAARNGVAVSNQDGTAENSTALAAGQTVLGEAMSDEEAAEYSYRELALLTAKRQLEEVRLAMSASANYSLLKQGISIDTEPLAKLVEELRQEENAYYEKLLKAQGIESSDKNTALFRETTEKVADLKSVPAYVLGSKTALTIEAVHEKGMALKDTFERANERYETLMTVPRADFGDSIQKAFQNVDDILQDIGMETSEANRRAVRILAYNELEITPEAVKQMKGADEEVQRVFRNMTPAVVTQMIKRGINPLDMDFASLNQTAEQIQAETGSKETEKFAEYLWKLEQNAQISEEERSGYIGIYRLIHQVEQTDGAAIGALMHQGADFTMRNLLTAVRSEHRSGKMDYTVDGTYEAAESDAYAGTSITEQIEAAYQMNCVKDILEQLTPENIRNVMEQTSDWENMTPEQLKEALNQQTSEEGSLDYAYAKEQLAMLEQSAKASQDIYTVLAKYDLPNTMSNVMAVQEMMRNRNGMFRQIFGDVEKDDEIDADDLKQIKQELIEEFGEAVTTPEEMAKAQENLGKLAENVMKTMIESKNVTSLDVREMKLLAAQLSVNNRFSKEEQYAVPVLVEEGVVNVSLKIVRGTEKKGMVDIMLESRMHGKIAATFSAQEKGISGLVVSDNKETNKFLEEHGQELFSYMREEEVNIHYAQMPQLDLNHFSSGLLGMQADDLQVEQIPEDDYKVQTGRLYGIAESFIRLVRENL